MIYDRHFRLIAIRNARIPNCTQAGRHNNPARADGFVPIYSLWKRLKYQNGGIGISL